MRYSSAKTAELLTRRLRPIGPTIGRLGGERSHIDLVIACVWSLVLVLGVGWLHPRLGVRDVDAYSYVVGSYSLQNGEGYRDLSGKSLWHWPPGYSLLLAASADPLTGALVLNYVALGVACAVVYLLARQVEWSQVAALGLATVLGSGFLRILATSASPDILTYASFLVALGLHQSPWRRLRLLSYGIWIVLIPVKLIAVVFAPAALLADLRATPRPRGAATWWTAAVVGLGWAVTAGAMTILLLLNDRTRDSPLERVLTPVAFLDHLIALVTSLPRGLISAWYGSIKEVVGGVWFALMLVAGVVALATLRPVQAGRWLRYFGLAVLGFSFCLLPIASFDTSTRLMSYGVLALALSFKPRPGGDLVWVGYGLVGLLAGLVNLATVNSFGVNDPRYQELTRQAAALGLGSGRLVSNSYHLTDVHARIAGRSVASATDLAEQPSASGFLWVTLPAYDAIATVVTPMSPPGAGWSRVWEIDGAVLFRKDD